MSQKTKNILVRLPADLGDELEQALFAEPDMNATELLIQGLVIRLRMPGREKLPQLLSKLGYERRPAPGRPRKAAAEDNGSAPAEPAAAAAALSAGTQVPPDGWDLDVTS